MITAQRRRIWNGMRQAVMANRRNAAESNRDVELNAAHAQAVMMACRLRRDARLVAEGRRQFQTLPAKAAAGESYSRRQGGDGRRRAGPGGRAAVVTERRRTVMA